jgi:hypothetical protein
MKLLDMNKTDLSSKPSLTEGMLLELPLEEVENLLELTLRLTPIILESLSCIITLVNVDIKDIVPGMNPWSAEKEELMSSLVDKTFIASGGIVCVGFFIRIFR